MKTNDPSNGEYLTLQRCYKLFFLPFSAFSFSQTSTLFCLKLQPTQKKQNKFFLNSQIASRRPKKQLFSPNTKKTNTKELNFFFDHSTVFSDFLIPLYALFLIIMSIPHTNYPCVSLFDQT